MTAAPNGRNPLDVLEAVPHRFAVPLLLVLFVVAGFLSLRGDSATSDETAHIGAGVSYLDTSDFRMNPEHPPLVKMWAALPLHLLGRADPDYGTTAWAGSASSPGAPRTFADQWTFGFELLNGPLADAKRRDPALLLVPARAMILALGVLLGVLVYVWSRQLWGRGGALMSLVLFCASPTMLAHARLVTTDLAAAAGFTGAAYALRGQLLRPGWSRLLTAGLATGAALLTKFSTLLLVPIVVTCAAAWVAFQDDGTTRRRRVVTAVLTLVGTAAIAWAVVWAGYGFRYAASTDPGYVLPWDVRAANRFGIPPTVAFAREHRLLPEAFLFGVTSAMQDEVRLAFLNGQESEIGWRSYFPIAFALKTPPAFIVLTAWALAAGFRRRRITMQEAAFVVVPLLVYAGFSVQSRLNIGHRHLAPLDPFLLVACGAIPSLAAAGRIRGWIATALLAGQLVSFAAASPGYLSYFNVLGGGARNGWRHLLDSNIDWGQDLGRLARWMRSHGVSKIHLAYFGTADPKAYGIEYSKVAMFWDFRPSEPATRPAPGERLAVSVNLFQGLYLSRDRALAEETWRRGWIPIDRIREYTDLRAARIERAEPYPRYASWAVSHGYLTEGQIRDATSVLLSTWMDDVRTRGRIVDRAGDSILIVEVPP